MRKIFVLSMAGMMMLQAGAQIRWPEITQQSKPWTRWWWEGSAVTKKDLSWNLEQYKDAGLGGVEITPIYGIHGFENQFIPFLSPQWLDMLRHTLAESRRLNLGVDLANATGWPFGGPWVSDADASKSVYFKTYSVNGGASLNEPVEYNQEAFVRTANNKPVSADSLKQPIAANTNLQALALDQVVFAGKLPLEALMAYSDKGAIIDLTAKVDAKGRLSWTAPEGKWNLYALFSGLHGKMVERAAPGGEGYALDHFSATAANHYFAHFDEAFKGMDLSYLRAFFNDSYEVDDARGQSNWTPGFFTEFKKRRGYELKDFLPALLGKDNADRNSRVLYDYRATIDELILEHFTEVWSRWGKSKGALVRNQSHGSPANTLDLYSAVDIPETEGTDVLRFKFASSAAHVSGKTLASSESATWLNEHFLSSWGDVKKAIDLYFLGGVNHIFYHGTAYSPEKASWPGWLFYAAVHFQPVNPQRKDFSALNQYVARVQSFLQKGKPDNDNILYKTINDRKSEPGRDLLQHFDGMERNFEGTAFEQVSHWMLDHGYNFDFFSDRQLEKISFSNGRLHSGGNDFTTLLLPANKLISGKSFEKIMTLASMGAQVLVYKDLPADVPGLGNLEARRKIFMQQKQQLKFTTINGIQKAIVGKGAIMIGDDLDKLLPASKARKETMVEKGLQSVRRKNADGYTYFITNRSDSAIRKWVPIQTSPASVIIFNPYTGVAGLARVKHVPDAHEIYLELQPYESVIVQTFNTKKSGPAYPYPVLSGSAIAINGNWSIEFLEGGPVLPAARSMDKTGSWTELDGEDVKNFSGRAKYAVSFEKPAALASAWLLDLGSVHETAQVWLNGKKIATLIGPGFRVEIPSSALQISNRLEIVVANLMANRIAWMDRNQLPWKIFYNTNMPARKRENTKNGLFDAASWAPLPSGLLGPVTLTPLRYE